MLIVCTEHCTAVIEYFYEEFELYGPWTWIDLEQQYYEICKN